VAGGAVAVLLVALLIVLLAAGRSNASSAAIDAELQKAAARALPLLNQNVGTLPIKDSSIGSFQAWIYGDEEPAFARILKQHQPLGVFIQTQFSDPNTMPPQNPVLHTSNHGFITIDASVTSQVARTGQPGFADVQAGGQALRAYVVRITLPGPLQGSGIYGLLEVIGASA